jgi:ABC-type cobalamin/Fe3+-siderophores transport system ATPase subunit
MNIAAEYSDRLVVMHSGEVLIEGTPREVFAHEELLKKSNLEPPQITKVMNRLGLINPLAIDLEEANILIDEILGVKNNG